MKGMDLIPDGPRSRAGGAHRQPGGAEHTAGGRFLAEAGDPVRKAGRIGITFQSLPEKPCALPAEYRSRLSAPERVIT